MALVTVASIAVKALGLVIGVYPSKHRCLAGDGATRQKRSLPLFNNRSVNRSNAFSQTRPFALVNTVGKRGLPNPRLVGDWLMYQYRQMQFAEFNIVISRQRTRAPKYQIAAKQPVIVDNFVDVVARYITS